LNSCESSVMESFVLTGTGWLRSELPLRTCTRKHRHIQMLWAWFGRQRVLPALTSSPLPIVLLLLLLWCV
jgi:hypothetical protein